MDGYGVLVLMMDFVFTPPLWGARGLVRGVGCFVFELWGDLGRRGGLMFFCFCFGLFCWEGKWGF